uniref:Uncharacterized protein LOC104214852 n=1 Tax=Nicotiana sylvestris TaxID=4096 RepID=A0A1U7V921_NICSY|nr:PREDICTED: uncharacterized protein LOC104214852 [Nicotiana sylvestris]
MANKFTTAHAGAKKAEARVNDIFAIRQTTDEGLRDFLAHFNRVRMSLPNVSEGMAVAAFQNELNRNGSKATKKLLNEDDLNGLIQRLTSVQTETRRDRRNDGRRDQLSRFNRERHQPYIRTSIPPPLRHADATPRHTATHQNEREIVYALQKLGTKVQWPQKMKSDPSTRISNGYLKELLSDRGWVNLTRGCDQPQGPPKPPSPPRTIQMIIGGGDDIVINHVKFTTTHKLKQTVADERYDDLEDSIIFDKLDTNNLSFPHYDALVITLCIADTDVKRIMVDDGSGTCIIHPRVLI